MVVNELVKLRPDLRVTIRSTTPHAILQQRFECEFHHIPLALDFGMKMLNAIDVEVEESAAAYRQFHRDWPARVAWESSAISELKPDLLLANVPYLSLAAARVAKVRSVGMCSLNWADIYQYYCVKDASSRAIHSQMLEAYSSAEHFLKVQPAMEMSNLDNTRNIGPVARIGRSQRLSLASVCNVVEGEKLVLLAMGGMEFCLPVQSWPRIPGVHWIVPHSWDVNREDVTALELLPFHFTDVLASCDAIITKPGYGIFTEAACAGVPVLYVTRQDWPEEPALTTPGHVAL